jgi:hypothetical protein
VLKKAVDRRFGAIPRLTHVRNPLILREPNSDAEPVAWRFYPNRAFFSTLLVPHLLERTQQALHGAHHC